MPKIIALNNNIIDGLIGNPEFAEFSFLVDPPRLSQLAPPPAKIGCGGCKRRRKSAARRAKKEAESVFGIIDHDAIRVQVLALNDAQRDALKQKLNVTGLRIRYRNAYGDISCRTI